MPRKTVATLDHEIDAALAGQNYYYVADRGQHRTLHGPFSSQEEAERASYFAKPVDERDEQATKGRLDIYLSRGVQRYDPAEIRYLNLYPEEWGFKSVTRRRTPPPMHATWKKFAAEFRNFLRDKDLDR